MSLSRTDALRAVKDRLALARKTRDDRVLLTERALQEARDLHAATNVDIDPEAAESLAWLHWLRSEELSGDAGNDDLHAAIALFLRLALIAPALVPDGIAAIFPPGTVPRDAVELEARAAELYAQYARSGDSVYLVFAINILKSVLAGPVEPPLDRAKVSSDYCGMLAALVEPMDPALAPEDVISEGIELARQSVALAPQGHPHRGACLTNLSLLLGAAYRRHGRLADLHEAAQASRQALAVTARDDPNHPVFCNNLMIVLDLLYKRTQEARHLEEAVAAARNAVAFCSPEHPLREKFLSELGAELRASYRHTGLKSQLREAVVVCREAVDAAGSEQRRRASALGQLGMALYAIYEADGRMEDLDESVDVSRAALELVRADDPDPTAHLSRLSILLAARHRASGHIVDLREAVELGQETLALTPLSSTHYNEALTNLAVLRDSLFRNTDEILDLRAAIDSLRDLISVTGQEHPQRSAREQELGRLLLLLAQRTDRPEPIREAITLVSASLAATPFDEPEYDRRLAGLTSMVQLLRSYEVEQGSEPEDAPESPDTGALKSCADSHSDDLPADPNALFRSLNRKIDGFVRAGEAEPLMSEECRFEASELARIAARTNQEQRLLGVVTWALWFRFQHGRAEQDVLDAARHARRLLEFDPKWVPPPLQRVFGHAGLPCSSPTSPDPEDWYLEGTVLIVLARHDPWYLGSVPAALREIGRAVPALPDDSPALAASLVNLCGGVELQAGHAGYDARTDEALTTVRENVSRLADADMRSDISDSLCGLLLDVHNDTADFAALEQAQVAARMAIDATPPDDPFRPARESNLGGILVAKFKITGDRTLLKDAENLLRRTLTAMSPEGPHRDLVMAQLAIALVRTAEADQDPLVTAESVEYERQVLALRPSGHPYRSLALINLAGGLHRLFELRDDPALLAEARTVAEEGVSSTRDDAKNRQLAQFALTCTLRTQSERNGDTSLLCRAIGILREMVAETSARSPSMALYRTSLGDALRAMAERTADPRLLAESVQECRAALAASAPDTIDHLLCLKNLAHALQISSWHTGDLTAIEEGIGLMHARLAQPSISPERRRSLVSDYGSMLVTYYERTGLPEVLDEAISMLRGASEEIATGDPRKAMIYYNYSGALLGRFLRTSDPADVSRAVELLREAVALEASGSPERIRSMASLGAALALAHRHRPNIDMIGEAVAVLREALAARPPDNLVRVICRLNLGIALADLYEFACDERPRREAIDVLTELIEDRGTPPTTRIAACRRRALLAVAAGDWSLADDSLRAAVADVPIAASRRLVRRDQQIQLVELGGLASDAAACALNNHQSAPMEAVMLLEAGRSILMSQQLDTRTDLAALYDHEPQLAQRFSHLVDVLDDGSAAVSIPLQGAWSPASTVDARHRAADDLDAVLAEIRAVEGHEDFLRPPRADQLLEGSEHGPVVVVNVSRYRSDALVIADGVVDVLPLPKLRHDEVTDRVTVFQEAAACTADPQATRIEKEQAETNLTEVLGWLWDVLAAPVLDRLRLMGAPTDGGPTTRLWWCPTGLLSLLPIHAAGRHLDPASRDTVLDRVVSSYTSTIRALRSAQTGRRDGGDADQIARLVVSIAADFVGEAAGEESAALPSAEFEARNYLARYPDARALRDTEATRERLLEELPYVDWVHFACHALSVAGNPSQSHLKTADGPLSVQELARLRGRGSRFAFLSACETGLGSAVLPDEAIHLLTAFQMAGYDSVIGTLWRVHDPIAIQLAESFYAAVDEAGEERTRAADLAHALHRTIVEIRDLYPDRPSLWASHIHTGP